MSITGTRLTMISLYTLQRFAHFSRQDSIASVEFSRTTWCLRNGWPRHSLSETLTLYFGQTIPNLHPTTCWSASSRASRNLINYARAHNSLWLHTAVSSMNHLSSLWAWVVVHRKITRVLQDFQKKQATLGTPGASIHPDVNLSCHLKFEPLSNNLTSVMDFTQTQTTSTSIA